MTRLTSTTTFRVILLFLAVAVLLDGISTFAALSIGFREANPVVNALGGPAWSIVFRAAFVAVALYRCRTWDKPRRIAILNVSHALVAVWTLFFAALNFYVIYEVLNG